MGRTPSLLSSALIVEPMKQVHDPPLPARNESKDDKANQASIRFVNLFRRVAAESQKEKLTDG